MPSWSAATLELVADLLPGAGERLIEAISAEVPVYSGEFEGELTELARAGVEQALGRFEAALRDPDALADPGWRAMIAELGASAVRAGRSLDALLAAYRVGARHAWREITTAGAAAEIEPEELYRLAEELFLYIDQLSAVSAEGYGAEQAQRAGERLRQRQALAALLLQEPAADPAALADAARDAGWPVPAEVAALAVATDDPERLAARIGPETLASPGEAAATLVVPDPMAPGRVAVIRGAVHAQAVPAALGPTVTVKECRRSADRATRALALAREGVLSDGEDVLADGEADDPRLLICDDHLLELLIHRDESLLADVAAHALRPLNELSPKVRARLLETLRAFLDHEGRMDPTAHALGVHPQTVRYRVAQLRELLGQGMEDADGRLALSLALRRPLDPDRAS